MKLSDKINIKKALIVFPIVAVMAGTTLIGAFSTVFVSDGVSPREQVEETVEGKNLEDLIKDEKAIKIIDIHENLESYVDKEVTLEGFFIDYDKQTKVFGVEVPLEKGEMTMVALSTEIEDAKILETIESTDLVKATGTISSFEDSHPEDEQTDEPHTHTIPKFIIKSVEVII